MSDRKLLERIARAVGLNFDPTFHGKFGLRVACEHDQGEQYDWNPFVDNGDAVELANFLGLKFQRPLNGAARREIVLSAAENLRVMP